MKVEAEIGARLHLRMPPQSAALSSLQAGVIIEVTKILQRVALSDLKCPAQLDKAFVLGPGSAGLSKLA